ncbi:MAG: hypothetical protein K2J16_04635 [Clostridia bacterium]|nr:hypothetical protein [Clostridia bacterium]
MYLKEILRGKRISILGDSLSSFEGVSNNANINATISKNPAYYGKTVPFKLADTWWMRLINKYEMVLCVNNSWSGGLLYNYLPEYIEDNMSGEYRAHHLADNGGNLPDIIIVFIGVNDLWHAIGWEQFGKAYHSVLETITKQYPNAETFCVGMPDRDTRLVVRAQKLNAAIRQETASHGNKFHYVDLYNSILNNDTYAQNTLDKDKLHLSTSGMQILADIIENSLKELEMK